MHLLHSFASPSASHGIPAHIGNPRCYQHKHYHSENGASLKNSHTFGLMNFLLNKFKYIRKDQHCDTHVGSGMRKKI